MRKRICCLVAVCILTANTLTGCWDKIEIDQRGFVEVVLFDTAPPGYEEKVTEETKDIPGLEKQKGPMVKVTYVFPNTGLLAGQGGGGGNEPGFTSMSSIAMSVPEANRFVDARLSRRLFFGHTQVVVFSEDFFKDTQLVKKTIDSLRRDPQFSRTVKVLITPGEASKIAEVKPKTEKLLFRYIYGILQNEDTNARILSLNLSELVTMMSRQDNSAIIPKVVPNGDELKISGAALIKNNRFIGYLPEFDTVYFNTLKGNRKGGRETANVDNISVEFATNNTSRSLKLVNSAPDKLEVEIDVLIEGTLIGGEFGEELFNKEFISKAEKELNKLSDDRCSFVLRKLQKEFNVDALEINEYLKKFHPEVWDQVKGRWDEIYPNIKITPKIDNRIRRIGTVK